MEPPTSGPSRLLRSERGGLAAWAPVRNQSLVISERRRWRAESGRKMKTVFCLLCSRSVQTGDFSKAGSGHL